MMKQGHKTWMAAVAFALYATAAVAVPVPSDDAVAGGPDASALLKFYGVSLATSPAGAAEDQPVWMAKVQGMIAQAPAWLQQNVLASKTKAEFASNMALLEQMQKGSLESGASAVKVAAASRVKAQDDVNPDLGISGPADLVYTALPPCRIMDTRNASGASGVQGPLVGNTLYNIPGYITAGQNWGQYGQLAPLSDCGLNSTAGNNIYAVAIVITILNPNFDAYLGVSDSSTLSTVLSKVALNYTQGQGLSTMYIVPQIASKNIYFAMPAGLSANLIFDVVGYFANSQATALQCQGVSATGVGINNFPNNTYLSVPIPACTAGYTQTGTGCSSGLTSGFGLSENSPTIYHDCYFYNSSGSTLDKNIFKAEAVCCRVPGR